MLALLLGVLLYLTMLFRRALMKEDFKLKTFVKLNLPSTLSQIIVAIAILLYGNEAVDWYNMYFSVDIPVPLPGFLYFWVGFGSQVMLKYLFTKLENKYKVDLSELKV